MKISPVHLDELGDAKGRVLEILGAEAYELHELAKDMAGVSATQNRGWLQRYVRAHIRASKIIAEAINRSHT